MSSRIDSLAQSLLAVTALLKSRAISPSTRKHLERMQEELQAEVAVLKDDQEERLAG